MMTDSQRIKVAQAIYKAYYDHYDGEVQGCCPVIADDIMRAVGGEAVGGVLCFAANQRTHWWVEVDGIVLDPMGDDILSYEKWGERREEHRDQATFQAILPRYERWRIPLDLPAILAENGAQPTQ